MSTNALSCFTFGSILLARYSKTRWQTFAYAHAYSSAFSLDMNTTTNTNTRRAKKMCSNCAYACVVSVLSTVMIVLVPSTNGHFTEGGEGGGGFTKLTTSK